MTQAALPRREISRELSRIANASVAEVLNAIGKRPISVSHRIGVSGPPGGGKSTLINALAARRISDGLAKTLAILAIDPTSPISGGAILGDRIRMDGIAAMPGMFIRSLSSRGATNGLCDNIVDLLTALEGHGFDETILETVGVGQSEVAVHSIVDTLVVIVPPDAGDEIQTMKSGLLEMADIVAVTKSEQAAARRMAAALESVVGKKNGKKPPVIKTSNDGTGIAELSDAIEAHRRQSAEDGTAGSSPQARRHYHLRSLVERRLNEVLSEDGDLVDDSLQHAYERVVRALHIR